MSLFWQEVKKIWRPGLLAVLALLGAVFYLARIDYYSREYPGGAGGQTDLLLAAGWVARYGPTLEDAEAEEIRSVDLARAVTEADAMVAQSEMGQKYGLKTVAEFEKLRDAVAEETGRSGGKVDTGADSPYRDMMLLGSYLYSDDPMAAPWRAQAIEGTLRRFDLVREWARGGWRERYTQAGCTPRELSRIEAANFGPGQAWRSLIPWEALEAASKTMYAQAVWLVLSTLLLVSPPLVRDRAGRMRAMQWSSRRGRGILRTQLAAALFSALMWAALNLAVVGALFFRQGYSAVAACRIIGFQSFAATAWWNLTYGGWCALLAALAAAMALGAAALAFFLAQYSAGYVAMLLKLIPLGAVLAALTWRTEQEALLPGNQIYRATGLPFAELFAAALPGVLGMALCLAACLRQRTRELDKE